MHLIYFSKLTVPCVTFGDRSEGYDMGRTGFAFVTVNIDRYLQIPQMMQATMKTTILETHSVSAALGLPVQVSDLTLL